MSVEAVASRYAKAVFELARDENKVSSVTKELRGFSQAYELSDDFQQLDRTPGVSSQDRMDVVAQIGKRLNASDLAVRTVSMLADRQRLSCLPEMLAMLETMADEHLGVLRAHVASAKRLPDGYRAKLKQQIEQTTGKKVVMSYEEDESLIAGIVTQIGDRVIDGSIRGKLRTLAESLRHA